MRHHIHALQKTPDSHPAVTTPLSGASRNTGDWDRAPDWGILDAHTLEPLARASSILTPRPLMIRLLDDIDQKRPLIPRDLHAIDEIINT